MSLSQLLKSYEASKRAREKRVAGLRGQLERQAEEASIAALKLQNHRVNHIHKNQQAIESRLRKHTDLLAELRKNEDLWASLYEQLNRALMQAGDLVHYAGYVEAEIGQILGTDSVARYLEEAENEPALLQQIQKVNEEGQAELEKQESAQLYEEIVEQAEKFDSVI